MSKPYRKIELRGVRFYVVRETEHEMLVAARMSLIPFGVEAHKAGAGWGVLWFDAGIIVAFTVARGLRGALHAVHHRAARGRLLRRWLIFAVGLVGSLGGLLGIGCRP